MKNKYKVPVKLWNEFTEGGQRIFNETMDQALPNQSNTIHPHQRSMSNEYWETICRNISTYAAFAAGRNSITAGSIIETPIGAKTADRV